MPSGPDNGVPKGASAVAMRVLTTPAGVILRIALFPVSATYTLPLPSTATPRGLLNLGVPDALSTLPLEPATPARVVTVPSLAILRMVWLKVSATKALPEPSAATPSALLRRAAVRTPSTFPEPPRSPATKESTFSSVLMLQPTVTEMSFGGMTPELPLGVQVEPVGCENTVTL